MFQIFSRVYILISIPVILMLILENRGLEIELEQKNRPNVDFDTVHDIELHASPILGDPNAPITIVEYSDFECPACQVNSDLVVTLNRKYPGQLKWAYKHFPLSYHENSVQAARAAMAANIQGRFWDIRREFLNYNDTLSTNNILAIVRSNKIDYDQFIIDFADPEWDKLIQRDQKEGQKMNIMGTPTYFINGVKVASNRQEDIEYVIRFFLES